MKLNYKDKRRIYGQKDIYQAVRGTEASVATPEKINIFDSLSASASACDHVFYASEFEALLCERVFSLVSLTGFFQAKVFNVSSKSSDLKERVFDTSSESSGSEDKVFNASSESSGSEERVFVFTSITGLTQESVRDSLRAITGAQENISAVEYLNAVSKESVYSLLSYATPLREQVGITSTTKGAFKEQIFDVDSVALTEKIRTFTSESKTAMTVQAVGHIADTSTGQMISIVFNRENVTAAEEIFNIILELVNVLRTVTAEAEYLKASNLEVILMKTDSVEGFSVLVSSETINILLTNSEERKVLRAMVEEE